VHQEFLDQVGVDDVGNPPECGAAVRTHGDVDQEDAPSHRAPPRADLEDQRERSCIVAAYDTTGLVPPGAAAWLDRRGNISIELPASSS